MSDEAIMAALKWKNSFAEKTDAAMYLVTQFCFEAAPIIAWDKMLQAEGNKLPIYIGLPGLATLKSLLAHARACGVGASMKILTKQAKTLPSYWWCRPRISNLSTSPPTTLTTRPAVLPVCICTRWVVCGAAHSGAMR